MLTRPRGMTIRDVVMLPTNFDTSTVTNPALLKIVRTLETYGAYVVDRNVGTPYSIYVENGANFNLMPNGWDDTIAAHQETADLLSGMRPWLTDEYLHNDGA